MLVCVFTMAPVERPDFTIGLLVAGVYEEIWNTELEQWGGVWKEHNRSNQEGLWKLIFRADIDLTFASFGGKYLKIKRVKLETR